MLRRTLGTFALIAVVFAVSAAPAYAGGDNPSHDDRRISVTGGVVVASDEVVDGAVVSFDGPVTVNGTVNGRRLRRRRPSSSFAGMSTATSSSCTATS